MKDFTLSKKFTWPWKPAQSNGTRIGMILGITAGTMVALTATAMATKPIWERWIQEWKGYIKDPVEDPETGTMMARETKIDVDRMEDEGGTIATLVPAHGA